MIDAQTESIVSHAVRALSGPLAPFGSVTYPEVYEPLTALCQIWRRPIAADRFHFRYARRSAVYAQEMMSMFRSIVHAAILASLFLGSCKELEQQSMPQKQTSYDLFLLIGQSNMAGRGAVSDEDRLVNPQVVTLNRENVWVPAVDPIHFDKPIAGVGPGRSFAIAVAEAHPGATIGLIPSAVGGSPISSWEPGALDTATNTHPYDDALRRALKAEETGTLKAILWHQGESDSHEALAPVYKEKLIALIGRLRQELGDPELPFLIGQLGLFSEKPWDHWMQLINEAHEDVAQEIEGVYFVRADGLEHKGDTLHFSAAAARELGRRYARTYNDKIK